MLRPAKPQDTQDLISLANATGIFEPSEAEILLGGVLSEFYGGRLGDGHQVVVFIDEKTETAHGWVCFAPSSHADGVWDLWWIGVNPLRQKLGVGESLLHFVEGEVRKANGRMLIIETSSTAALTKARHFYEKRGYLNCGTIHDFYGDADGKVTYAKKLT